MIKLTTRSKIFILTTIRNSSLSISSAPYIHRVDEYRKNENFVESRIMKGTFPYVLDWRSCFSLQSLSNQHVCRSSKLDIPQHFTTEYNSNVRRGCLFLGTNHRKNEKFVKRHSSKDRYYTSQTILVTTEFQKKKKKKCKDIMKKCDKDIRNIQYSLIFSLIKTAE